VLNIRKEHFHKFGICFFFYYFFVWFDKFVLWWQRISVRKYRWWWKWKSLSLVYLQKQKKWPLTRIGFRCGKSLNRTNHEIWCDPISHSNLHHTTVSLSLIKIQIWFILHMLIGQMLFVSDNKITFYIVDLI